MLANVSLSTWELRKRLPKKIRFSHLLSSFFFLSSFSYKNLDWHSLQTKAATSCTEQHRFHCSSPFQLICLQNGFMTGIWKEHNVWWLFLRLARTAWHCFSPKKLPSPVVTVQVIWNSQWKSWIFSTLLLQSLWLTRKAVDKIPDLHYLVVGGYWIIR